MCTCTWSRKHMAIKTSLKKPKSRWSLSKPSIMSRACFEAFYSRQKTWLRTWWSWVSTRMTSAISTHAMTTCRVLGLRGTNLRPKDSSWSRKVECRRSLAMMSRSPWTRLVYQTITTRWLCHLLRENLAKESSPSGTMAPGNTQSMAAILERTTWLRHQSRVTATPWCRAHPRT